ncbi:MAG: PH domain-containing protein [Fimbriimonadaceae bacterium]|nr:PH domain-containing protein [Fimbriimonadaceae bacterium]
MAEPVYHRIHPLTMVVELPRVIKQLFVAIILVIFQFTRKGGLSEELGFEVVAAALGALVIVPPLLRYYSFGYAIHEGKLLVKSGILQKNLRTIPLDRIQNINLTRSLLHRILGLVDLEIETAAGVKAEASISALTDEQAHVLKAQLMGTKVQSFSRVDRELDRTVIYRPTVKELLLVGASENRAGAMIAAVLGFGAFQPMLQSFFEQEGKQVARSARSLPPAGWQLIIAGIFVFILIGWIISIISAFVKYYNFELSQKDGNLKRTYGLINHFENMLPIKRIQTVHIDQNFIQRWLKICKMYAATAGGMVQEKKSEANQAQIATAPLLTPVLRDDMRDSLLKTALPKADVSNPEWQPVSKNTIYRHLRTGLWPSLFFSGLMAVVFWIYRQPFTRGVVKIQPFWDQFGPYLTFTGLMLLALLSGWIYWKCARWSDAHSVIITRLGWFKRRWNYLPMDKVQLVSVSQSPAQRWFKLATVDFDSAAPTFQKTEIDDMPIEEAFALAKRVHTKSGDSRDSLVDGF